MADKIIKLGLGLVAVAACVAWISKPSLADKVCADHIETVNAEAQGGPVKSLLAVPALDMDSDLTPILGRAATSQDYVCQVGYVRTRYVYIVRDACAGAATRCGEVLDITRRD